METNIIYCGDCLKVMEKIPDNSIDLIYIDPPFFSQRHYEDFWIKDKASKFKFSDKDWEKLRSKINPVILKEYEAIEKRWKGGHKGIYVYIAYMRERLDQCWRVLKPIGSIYLHCDWHAGHYLKVMMDEIFGYNNLVNEIVWFYKTGGASKDKFARKHDTIFLYQKSNKRKFNPLKEKSFMMHKYGFKKSDFKIDKETGLQYSTVYMKDVWELPAVGSATKERLGYPTQKPEILLERIIKASSNEGDIVLDPFCGCGTTLAVAKKLNRKWIGIDISRTACDVMRKRLGQRGLRVVGGESEKELSKMEPHEFARIIIVEKLDGTVNPRKIGDMGIDGWVEFMARPVQVKRWKHKVQRQEIDKFAHALQREKKKKGMVVAFDFSKDCWNEVERIKHEDKIDIQLKTVRDIMGLEYYNNH